jgi:hypothetical protein
MALQYAETRRHKEAELCNAIRRQTGGAGRVCGYQMGAAKRQCPAETCLSNHFDRMNLVSDALFEALLCLKQVEELQPVHWGARASSGPPIASKCGGVPAR